MDALIVHEQKTTSVRTTRWPPRVPLAVQVKESLACSVLGVRKYIEYVLRHLLRRSSFRVICLLLRFHRLDVSDGAGDVIDDQYRLITS
jgi:hypothetical protein